jgi:hypothetical protein
MDKQDLRTEAFEGHSPAPWRLEDVQGCASIFDAEGQDIGYLSGIADLEQNDTNGRLMVAAPALLADRDRLQAEADRWRKVAEGLAKAASDVFGLLNADLDAVEPWQDEAEALRSAVAAYDAAVKAEQ